MDLDMTEIIKTMKHLHTLIDTSNLIIQMSLNFTF